MYTAHQIIRAVAFGKMLRDLEDLQICIDSLRDGGVDQWEQLELDRQQTEVDKRRRVAERALATLICPN